MAKRQYKGYWIADCEKHCAVMVYPIGTKKPNEYLVSKAFDIKTAKTLIDSNYITEDFWKVHTNK